jgi:adenosylcobalamin-dependent ribonucleoside-triphosphate reductase
VDDNHTVAYVLNYNEETGAANGIFTSNCGEIALEGKDGELCNLVETFPSKHESYEDYEKTCKVAYIYAKTVTLVPTHNQRINQVINRNRRIGISQSGVIESFQKHGRRGHFNWCDKAYKYLRKLDKEYSRNWLGVPTSIKITTIKPSGTVSLLPGVTPGVHYAHSEYYYRTIRVDKTSPLIKPLRKAGHRIEESVYGDNTLVVYFPVHEENFDRSKTEVSIWEQLENVAQLQNYWCDNQVSATVTFKPEEADQIHKALEMYETRLKGVSFLPLTDHQYAQAPYQEIDKAEYEKAVAKLKPLVLVGDTHEAEEKFCTTDACEIKQHGANSV